MIGKAFCHGAATIVNGIALGKGAAYGIALETTAEVELTDEPDIFNVKIVGDENEKPLLSEHCVKNVLKKFDLLSQHGAKITTRSDIPISRGLKSSSASANAIVLAVYRALDRDYTDLDIINLGIDAAFSSKVTLTGAFDDACAAYFGNVVVTDNNKRKILAQYPIEEDYEVIIHVPQEKIRKNEVDISKLKGIEFPLKVAHDLALNKNYQSGILINGLAYSNAMELDNSIALLALDAGAVTAGISGTGPATVILSLPDDKDNIISAIESDGDVICTKINREKAGILND